MRFLLAILVGLVGATLSGSAGEKSTPQDKQIKAILAAEHPIYAAKGHNRLFKSVKADGLRRLQMNSSDTIAIQAAWQEVEHTLPEKDQKKEIRPDPKKLNWFLGFLEGRGRLKAPKWWANAILDGRAYCRGGVFAGGVYQDVLDAARGAAPKARPKGEGFPPLASFAKKDGKRVVRTESASMPIPDDLPEKLDRGEYVRAIAMPSSCFIAAHDPFGMPYQLACVDGSSPKIRWITKVWGSCFVGAQGFDLQQVEITVQGDRVVVFGISAAGFYVEAFRVKDGVNVFRFSNAYPSYVLPIAK
jgi:hypothetical protein